MGDESEWMKLPTEQKVEHKAWKARISGYEELTKQFQMIHDEKSPEFAKYAGLMKKFVTESNAIAQEKSLDVVLLFVENAATNIIGRVAQDVCNGVVAKCFTSARAKTKEKALELLMLYIEGEKQEQVQDALMGGLTNKTPKVVAACVQALREGLRCFGPKIITVKPLVKQFSMLLEHRDKTIREEGKMLVVEVYRWIGSPIKPQLANLKPVQISELEAEFERLPPTKPQQERYLRSQQDLKAKHEAQAMEGGEEGGEGAEDEGDGPVEEVDSYDLMDPVEILSKLPKEYYDKIEAKKWQERKEMLEALKKLTENPKLAEGDYHDVVKTLKKVVAKDTNVMLVTLAAKIMTDLANGLRKKFSQHATGCIDACLDKFREKKITVVTALREAIDACFPCTTLDNIGETCVEQLNHKTPSVRAEVASFLARCFCKSTPTTLPKKLLKLFAAPLVKLTADSTPDVREKSFEALGTAMKVVGEKHLVPFLADMDEIKMNKIKEYMGKAELLTATGKPRGGGGAAKKAVPAPAAAAPAAPKARPGAPPKVVKPGSTSSAPSDSKPKAGGKVVKGGKKAPAKKAAGGAQEAKTETIISDETAEEKVGNLIPADSIAGLANSNWKERLASMEKFTDAVRPMAKDDIPCQACVRMICKKPGLKETNFQVMKFKVELIALLAKNAVFTRTSAEVCINDLVDKVGDVKNGGGAQEALSCIAEAVGLEYVSANVIDYAFTQKNPKNQSESLSWLNTAIREFGFKVNVKPLLTHIKKAFSATNPAIRTNAVALVGTLYMYMGATLRVFFEDEKAALLKQIDDEIEKVKDEKPPAPTRGVKASADDDEEEEEEEEEEGGGVNVADLVPRTDISDKITDEIITQMSDKNWKIRNEGIQRVITILNEAKFITANIGPLPEALKLRLGDSNKILVGHVLNICQTLATAMGPHLKSHVHVIGPGIIICLGDSKPQIRANAVTTLNQWVEQTGLALFFQNEIMIDALKIENPNLRTELLGWLASVLPNQKKMPVPEMTPCITNIFTCTEDRNPGVRAKAQEAIMPFMIHTGYDAFAKKASKVKPGSKDNIMKLLEKARSELPAKPTKAKAVKTGKAGGAKVVKPPPDEPAQAWEPDPEPEAEPERPATAPAKAGGKKGKVLVKKPPMSSKAAAKKAAEEEEGGPSMKVNNLKDQRFKDEKSMKVFKWNFTQPRGEFVEQLRTQMETAGFSKGIITQLFHDDFKQHIKAIERFQCELADVDATIANCDLILKWHTLRFFDTNTSMLFKSLEYLLNMFEALADNDYHLLEQEASSFIPYLVNKVGDPKDNVRKNIRAIFKQICKVYPSSKMFSFVLDGVKCKNSKQRMECLDELGSLIEIYGINVCQPSPAQALKLIAAQIGERDNSVRSAALNTIVSAYHILGETVYKYIGALKDKDQGMLEERIKRSSKTRPQTAPAKTSPEHDRPAKPQAKKGGASERAGSLPRPQTVPKRKKEFTLELDEDEDDVDQNMPKLESHNLDFLNDDIKLPETKMRPPSPSHKLLSTSSDAKTAIDLVIAQIASNEITTSIQALAQIDEVLRDSEKCQHLNAHVDQILVVCTLQLRMAYTKHMASTDNVVRLYKALIASLVALFECQELGQEASKDVLKDLVYQLLVILLDNRLNQLDDGPNIVRSVNVMVVKIVDKSNTSKILCALITLLNESLSVEAQSHKYLELIMKCLWKMVRMLPNVINELDIDEVVGELHLFFKAYPSHTWKSRGSDVPLRTIKTILHSLAKLKGNKIMNHMSRVDTNNSEVEAYLQKLLRSGVDMTTNKNNQNEAMNGDATPNKPIQPKTPSSRKLNKNTHDMLAEIFKKIGSKENTREGLNDLFDFKLQYPEADLDPFLKKSSQFFQSYIERGLKTIASEREGKSKISSTMSEPAMSNSNSATSLSSVASQPANMGGTGDYDSDAHVLRERLMVLRAKCGLDNTNSEPTNTSHEPLKSNLLSSVKAQDSGSNSSLSSNSSTGQSLPNLGSLRQATPAADSASDSASDAAAASVIELKKRLERIKNAMK